MPNVEVWQVLAVSIEFLKIVKALPEALFAESVRTAEGKVIAGSKLILTASSQEEVGVSLPGLVNWAVTEERPKLLLVRRLGKCSYCKPASTDDPNVPISDCPHIKEHRILTTNKVWSINVDQLREVAKAEAS